MERILIIEDEAPMRTALADLLAAEGYRVLSAVDGESGLQRALGEKPDLILLDVMLPKLDGFELCAELRRLALAVPVLMLTAKGQIEDRVAGLDAGADDYLVKPFSYLELSARARALLRRSHLPSESVLTVRDLCLDRVERKVERAGRHIELTVKEFALLEYLMRNAGRRLTRAMIIEHVWNLTFDSTTNVVDVYINYLRRKVDDGFSPCLIHTVRGVGYQMSTNGASA